MYLNEKLRNFLVIRQTVWNMFGLM